VDTKYVGQVDKGQKKLIYGICQLIK